ncbi:uncharacterized protein [Cherax quadricarinatus]|uniref:uncharacterized protein isoform X2 n=1 Tax=Cherax quadricarinatus TaxID=27406 RepID=UPI00387E862A
MRGALDLRKRISSPLPWIRFDCFPLLLVMVDVVVSWSPETMTKTNDDYIRNEEQDCKRDIEGILQICNSYDEALHLLQTEEKATGMHFVGHRKEGIFDMIGSDMKEFIGEGRKHIKYSASVETKGRGNNPVPVRYTGVPFIEAGTYIMECHMGHDSGVWKKRRYAANRDKKECENRKLGRRRFRSQDSKKLGCPARVHIKRILRLPDFKIKQNTAAERTKNRMKIVLALKDDLQSVNFQPEYYVLLPFLESHRYHVVGFVAGVMVQKGKDKTLHLLQIKKYLETGAYLSSVLSNEKKGIRVAAKAFRIEDKQMFYVGKDNSEKRIVLFTKEDKQKAFEECHILKKSGEHFDCTLTVYNLAEKYYWTSMAEDIVGMVVVCDVCKLNKRSPCREYKSDLKQQNQIVKHHKAYHLKRESTSLLIEKDSLDSKIKFIAKPKSASSTKVDDYLTSDADHKIRKESTVTKIDNFKVHNNYPRGVMKVVDSYEQVINLIKAEEKVTGMHFVGHRKEGIFDIIGSDMKAFAGEGRKHIRYSVSIGTKGRGYDPVPVEYTGVPFIEAGTYVMECQMGSDSGIWNKRRYAANRDKMEEKSHVRIRRRTLAHRTKKMGCPAKIHIKRILRMPDFKIKSNTKAEKEKNRERIIKALKDDVENVSFQTLYYILLPEVESHEFHVVDIVGGVRVKTGEAGLLHLQQIRHYLHAGTHLPSVQKKNKNAIRTSSKEFTIEGTTMYYTGKDRTEKRIVPHSETERDDAFQKCHILESGQHYDRTETLRRLVQKYYWTGLSEDVIAKIEECKVCQVNRLMRCDQSYAESENPERMAENMQLVTNESMVLTSSTLLPEGRAGILKNDTETVEIVIQELESHQDLSGGSYPAEGHQQIHQTTFGNTHKLDGGGHLVVIVVDTLD